jgi:hypothetical protein
MSMMVMIQKSMSLWRKMWVYWLVVKSLHKASEGAIGICRCTKVSFFTTWQWHYILVKFRGEHFGFSEEWRFVLWSCGLWHCAVW